MLQHYFTLAALLSAFSPFERNLNTFFVFWAEFDRLFFCNLGKFRDIFGLPTFEQQNFDPVAIEKGLSQYCV